MFHLKWVLKLMKSTYDSIDCNTFVRLMRILKKAMGRGAWTLKAPLATPLTASYFAPIIKHRRPVILWSSTKTCFRRRTTRFHRANLANTCVTCGYTRTGLEWTRLNSIRRTRTAHPVAICGTKRVLVMREKKSSSSSLRPQRTRRKNAICRVAFRPFTARRVYASDTR